jgi:phenylalanyl-tRNA synthetase beta chain
MKISYKWLKNYVDCKESPEELSTILTDTGLEVEGFEKFETLRGNLSGVLVGRVITCMKHPDADRLTLTTVDVGAERHLPIVCGAPNVAPGQKVFVATPGTHLNTPKGSFDIKKASIRGQLSEGMICAEDELGLGSSHEGIMVLPDEAPLGMPAATYLELAEDWVFDIGLTPNRIDAASHMGVARDIVAAINQKQKNRKLALKKPDTNGFFVDSNDANIPVFIEDPQACNRYCGLSITGLQVKASPAWLKNYLLAIGQKPINNIVDITNFVLHELGQPLHAFDISKIQGGRIVVKKSPKGSRFVTLDGVERILSGEDLMICHATEPMCMAGILGGIDSGVTESTTGIFLESAYFNPRTIRKSSNYHGIKTDASFRFERGADPDMTIVALMRAAMLMKEIAGGKISSDIVDVYPNRMLPISLQVSYNQIHRLVGKPIPQEEIKAILADLDFQILDEQGDMLKLSVPAYRVDVTREADVAEEILRIYGYNNIELPGKLHASIVLSPRPDKAKLQNIISDMLSANGFHEIMNNSLTKGSYYEREGFTSDLSVQILNPLSQDLNVLRQSLLFGGLETIIYNLNRRMLDMKLYEFGHIYIRQADEGKNNHPLDAYHERTNIALFMTGRRYPETWSASATEVGFFDLRSVINNIFDRFDVPTNQLTFDNNDGGGVFDYWQEIRTGGKTIATLGLLAKAVMRDFDIKQDVYYGVIEWEHLIATMENRQVLYREIPRFPEVKRDLALLLSRDVPFASIEKLAFETEKTLLKNVFLFDVYQDERLGNDKKSYAVSFTLQDEEKTLTDKEIEAIMEKLTMAFQNKLGATIR